MTAKTSLQREPLDASGSEVDRLTEEVACLQAELKLVRSAESTDLADSHKAQAALHETIARLREIIEGHRTSLGIARGVSVHVDEDGFIRGYSRRIDLVLPIRPGDIGRPLTDLVSRLSYPEMAEDLRSALASGDLVQRVVLARNESEAWSAQIRAFPMRDGTNHAVLLFRAVADINAESAVVNLTSDGSADAFPQYIYTVSRNRAITFLNKTWEPLTSEAVLGQDVLSFVAPEDRHLVELKYAELYATGLPVSYEAHAVGARAHELYRAQLSPITKDGKCVGAIAFATKFNIREGETEAQADPTSGQILAKD